MADDRDREWKNFLRKIVREAAQTSIHPNHDLTQWTLSVKGQSPLEYRAQWSERDVPGLGVVLRKLLEDRKLIFMKLEAEYAHNKAAPKMGRGRESSSRVDAVLDYIARHPDAPSKVVAAKCFCDLSYVNRIKRQQAGKTRKRASKKGR